MRMLILLLAVSLLAPMVGAEEDEAGENEVIVTASGLKIEMIEPGKGGTKPSPGDRVVVHYTGTLEDGTKFDSSVDRGEPFAFVLGQGSVIPGWDEGVALLNVGAKAKFTIPGNLAYGEMGRPPRIPSNATLLFTIELLDVQRALPWREPDAKAQIETDSGLKYEVLEEGEGEPAREDQGVSFAFAVFNRSGKPIVSSASLGQKISGACVALSLGQFGLPFLKEAAKLMKPGARCLFEVPGALGFGTKSLGPDLPANSVTIWQLEVLAVNDVPAFRLCDAEKVQTTETGIRYEVIREGEGESPKATDKVEVHYTGWLTTGKLFDSSHGRGETIVFPLNRVISGWTQGVGMMKPGAIYLFEIPGNLAYGPNPRPGSGIPPDATLVFLVELFGVK